MKNIVAAFNSIFSQDQDINISFLTGVLYLNS